MPCLECENGLWRFGESGKCEYTSKSQCEEAKDKKKDMAKKKYYSDEEHDHHFHFTQEMMETLHTEGELEVKVEKEGEEMIVLFTFDNEDKEIVVDKSNDEIILSMLDDELDEYIDKLAYSIKKL